MHDRRRHPSSRTPVARVLPSRSTGAPTDSIAGMTQRRRDPVRSLSATVTGAGDPVLLCHGFALGARTYRRTATLLGGHARVLLPTLVPRSTSWTYDAVLDALVATLDAHGVERCTVVAHSFGGGIALGLAVRRPDRVSDLVLANTLGLSRQWGLAREAFTGTRFLRLADPRATTDFFRSLGRHPVGTARAGWWAFRCDKRAEIAELRRLGTNRHVLWSADDSLLSPASGARFADELGAPFHLSAAPPGVRRLEHDWVYRQPAVFVDALLRLPLDGLHRTEAGARS